MPPRLTITSPWSPAYYLTGQSRSFARSRPDLASKSDTKLGFGLIFGLSVALWSANAGMKAIIDALNVVI